MGLISAHAGDLVIHHPIRARCIDSSVCRPLSLFFLFLFLFPFPFPFRPAQAQTHTATQPACSEISVVGLLCRVVSLLHKIVDEIGEKKLTTGDYYFVKEQDTDRGDCSMTTSGRLKLCVLRR